MPTEWFYTQSGSKCGPVDSGTLKELARTGQLKPEDLLWNEGMAEWKPAREAKKLFEGVSSTPPAAELPMVAEEAAAAPAADAENQQPKKASAKDDFFTSVGASVLIAVVAAIALHALQWFFGWGWGSLWAVLSSVVILSCGIIPWMRDHDGHKSPAAALGAGVGAVLGAAYGWFTGGLLSGILFCTSVGTWAAWLGNIRGLTSKPAQAGIVACFLMAFHVFGMLPPSGRVEEAGADRPISDKEYESIAVGTGKWDVQDKIGFPFLKDMDIQTEKVYGSRGEIFGSQYHETVTYAYRLKRHPDKLAMFIFKGTQAVDGSNHKLVEKGIVPRPPDK